VDCFICVTKCTNEFIMTLRWQMLGCVFAWGNHSSEPQHQWLSPRGTYPSSDKIEVRWLFWAENLKCFFNGAITILDNYWFLRHFICTFDSYRNQRLRMTLNGRCALCCIQTCIFWSPLGKFECLDSSRNVANRCFHAFSCDCNISWFFKISYLLGCSTLPVLH